MEENIVRPNVSIIVTREGRFGVATENVLGFLSQTKKRRELRKTWLNVWFVAKNSTLQNILTENIALIDVEV